MVQNERARNKNTNQYQVTCIFSNCNFMYFRHEVILNYISAPLRNIMDSFNRKMNLSYFYWSIFLLLTESRFTVHHPKLEKLLLFRLVVTIFPGFSAYFLQGWLKSTIENPEMAFDLTRFSWWLWHFIVKIKSYKTLVAIVIAMKHSNILLNESFWKIVYQL